MTWRTTRAQVDADHLTLSVPPGELFTGRERGQERTEERREDVGPVSKGSSRGRQRSGCDTRGSKGVCKRRDLLTGSFIE